MRIYVLTIGAIASIITTAAFANTVITSQTYVDNQDALKVNIAQGVGTNNANVGKTLVVNSQGNLELGAPAAGNYVEDSITDGVTNKAPSENAVHDALANKQNTIPATGTNSSTPGTTVVTYTSTAGTIGERGIYDEKVRDNYLGGSDMIIDDTNPNNPVTAGPVKSEMGYIPTVASVDYALQKRQYLIPATGTNASTPGATVVTYTSTAGTIGERGIYDGSTTYNSSTDANKLVTANLISDIQYSVDNMPTKTVTTRVCTRWIDGQSHTDANCLLWNLVDETVYGAQCNVDADCFGYRCSCLNHMCVCIEE